MSPWTMGVVAFVGDAGGVEAGARDRRSGQGRVAGIHRRAQPRRLSNLRGRPGPERDTAGADDAGDRELRPRARACARPGAHQGRDYRVRRELGHRPRLEFLCGVPGGPAREGPVDERRPAGRARSGDGWRPWDSTRARLLEPSWKRCGPSWTRPCPRAP